LVVVVVVLVVLHGRSRQQYPSLVESGIILLDGKNRRASESLRERRERQREESLKERERERERERKREIIEKTGPGSIPQYHHCNSQGPDSTIPIDPINPDEDAQTKPCLCSQEPFAAYKSGRIYYIPICTGTGTGTGPDIKLNHKHKHKAQSTKHKAQSTSTLHIAHCILHIA
jgi:hypothetical protein